MDKTPEQIDKRLAELAEKERQRHIAVLTMRGENLATLISYLYVSSLIPAVHDGLDVQAIAQAELLALVHKLGTTVLEQLVKIAKKRL